MPLKVVLPCVRITPTYPIVFFSNLLSPQEGRLSFSCQFHMTTFLNQTFISVHFLCIYFWYFLSFVYFIPSLL